MSPKINNDENDYSSRLENANDQNETQTNDAFEFPEWSLLAPIPTNVQHVMGAVENNGQLYVAGGADSLRDWSTNDKLFMIPIKELLEKTD